jgi:hypothetical protein
MTRRRARNDWRVVHELHRRVLGVVSRGGSSDTIANEIHGLYLRHGSLPSPAGVEIPRCPDHPGTAMESGRCPIPTCQRTIQDTPRAAARNDHRVTRELHHAVAAAVSRGSNLDDIATNVHTVYRRNGWKACAPAGISVSRCRVHYMTALKNNRCPTCGWSPLT